MTKEEFRIAHSTLIEQYQFIEFHLEGIYALVCGKGFVRGINEVDTDSIRRILNKIRAAEQEQKCTVFSDEERERLERMLLRRNFWCHNCYVELVFDRRTDAPEKENDIRQMADDLREAAQLRDALCKKENELRRARQNDDIL